MQRRVLTKEFILATFKHVVDDEMDVKEEDKQLGVHYNSLFRC